MFDERPRKSLVSKIVKYAGLPVLVLSLSAAYSCGVHDGHYHRNDKMPQIGESFYRLLCNMPGFENPDHGKNANQRKQDDLYRRLTDEQ